MPLTRYKIRNEYGLADPELYRAADRDDPEALLEGVAMAGLVGVLRQLGDLAEFAAEIFHDLHEEVMATATRGHGLAVRVQQLEADFPSIEKALLSQTHHSTFFSNPGVDWHPNLRSEQNLITRGDLPRFVMDSYEECRGPPRLFLLDKFDVAGAGASLKRYTDPSFFKVESAFSLATVEMQREKKIRKVKKKGSRWRNGETPEVALTSHAKLHELFLEERVENGYNDPARRVKLKKRHLNGSAVDPKTGKSYMKKFMETLSPEHKLVSEISITPPLLRLTSDNSSEPELRIVDISTVSPVELSPERESASSSPSYVQEAIVKPSVDGFNGGVFDGEIANRSETNSDGETYDSHANIHEVAVEKQLTGQGKHKSGSLEGSSSDGMTSEVDNYMDALATMDSEIETDNEYKTKNNLHFLNAEKDGIDSDTNVEEHLELQTRFSDSQSTGNSSTSDDKNNSFEKDRASLSHSDSLSNLVEDTSSECNGAAKEFPSPEACGTQIFDMSSNQHSQIVDSLEATSMEQVVSHTTNFQENTIPDNGDKFCSAFVREASPPQHSDRGASSPVVSLAESVLDETTCEEFKVGYELLDLDKSLTNLDTSMAFTSTPASDLGDKLDVEDLVLSSDALHHLSKVEELASENQSGNILMDERGDEDSTESVSKRNTESSGSSISTTEEHLLPSALPEVPTSSVNCEAIPVVVDDAALSHNSVESHLEVDAPRKPSLTEHQFCDLDEDVPQLESISAEVGCPHYREQFSVEETSTTVEDEELQVSTRDVDGEVDDTVRLELSSTCPTYPGDEDHVISDDVVPETLDVETVAVHSAAVAQPEDDVDDVSHSSPNAISSPARNFMNSHDSLPGSVRDSEGRKEVSQKEVSPASESTSTKSASYDLSTSKVSDGGLNFSLDELTDNSLAVCDVTLESNPSISTTYDHSSSKLADDGQNSSLDEQTEVCDVPTASTSLQMTHRESESQSDQSHKDDAPSPPTRYFPEPEFSLEKSVELEANQVEMEGLPRDGAKDQPKAALESSLVFLADQVDVDCSQEDQVSIESSSLQSVQIGSPNHMDKETSKQLPSSSDQINPEIHLDAPSESCPSNLLSQPLTLEFLPESASQELHATNQTVESLDSTLPRFVLPEATVVNLDDRPPLPPLPPMQWRMVKQNPSLTSLRDLGGGSQGSFLPIPPFGVNEKVQSDMPATESFDMPEPQSFDMPALQRGVWQPQNPYLPLISVEDEKFQHISEPSRDNMVQPAPYSLRLPTVVNDGDYQHSSPNLAGAQSQNPFLSISEVFDDSSGDNHSALEGEKVQSSSNPFILPGTEWTTSRQDPESSDEAITQPQQQLIPGCTTSRHDPESSNEAITQQQLTSEMGVEPEVLQHSLENSEREQGKPLATSATVPKIVDDQPQNSFPTSEGETTQSSNNSDVTTDDQVGRSNGLPVSKIPRPRNPLIDAVAAYGQSKLRKVTERVRLQVEPKVDERDSLLQQIRTKSFNLKPATVTRPGTVTRPSVQGPTTNLRVAAILEKANAIRQALAGSDEDDDDDSWSDS